MLGIGIIAVGICIIIVSLFFLSEKNITKWLQKRQKEAINNRDLANWFKLNLASMGGLISIVGGASLFFSDKNPLIFIGAACFIGIIFAGMCRMGYKLLVKQPQKPAAK